jgi:deaminated glutathione amidase
VTVRLRRNTAGVLVSEVDTDEEIYDSTAACRGRAMDRVLPSGTQVRDERSSERATVIR